MSQAWWRSRGQETETIRADALVAQVVGQAVGPGVRVAICAERSPQLLVGLLAIVKAGGS